MAERPILFSAPMVRAILDGRKTQTRRIVKCNGNWIVDGLPMFEDEYGDWVRIPCPLGTVGDRLWVREAFQYSYDSEYFDNDTELMRELTAAKREKRQPKGSQIYYRATDKLPLVVNIDTGEDMGWCPSIHMPRWASRITLEITGVRVERLQDISEVDAEAEGCERPILSATEIDFGDGVKRPVHPMTGYYRDAFQSLWDSTYGPESWNANPWVWVVEFRRVE